MKNTTIRGSVALLSLTAAAAVFVAPTLASAETLDLPHNIAGAKILSIGCHAYTGGSYQGVCWINIDKNSPLSCTYTNQIRFNTTTANGKNMFSLATAAFLAGKTVSLQVSQCFPEQSAFSEAYYVTVN